MPRVSNRECVRRFVDSANWRDGKITRSGSLWFQDKVLHSYQTPIARIVGSVLLGTAYNYSITTAQHISLLRRAWGTRVWWFTCPSIGASGGRAPGSDTIDHDMNLQHFAAEYMQWRQRAQRARARKAHYIAMANTALSSHNQYCLAFHLVSNVDWNKVNEEIHASLPKRKREHSKRWKLWQL